MAQEQPKHDTLPNFDRLWNWNDVAATEAKFREILPMAERAGDASYHVQLLTQIARTYSLRGKFAECHALLDTVEKMLTPDLKRATARYFLERGRAFNSANQLAKAMPVFTEAWRTAEAGGEMGLEIDALHMLAIAESDPHKKIEWNLKAIGLAEANPKFGWRRPLYNNIGDCYSAVQDYANALIYYKKLIALQSEGGGSPDIYTLKDEARATRLLGHPAECLTIVKPIFDSMLANGTDDGWMREEVAESLQAQGKAEDAKPHFVKAYELLSKDDYCINYEQDKLKHLKQMAE